MNRSSHVTRLMFAFAAAIAAIALSIHLQNCRREGAVNWPAATNMIGLFVLAATGVLDPPPGKLRAMLTVIALLLIFVSAFVLIVHEWHVEPTSLPEIDLCTYC